MEKGFNFSLIAELLIIALDIGLIDEVNDEIQELEKKLNVYVNQVLSDKERPQSTAQTLSPSTMKGESFSLHNNWTQYPTILLYIVMYGTQNFQLSVSLNSDWRNKSAKLITQKVHSFLFSCILHLPYFSLFAQSFFKTSPLSCCARGCRWGFKKQNC